EEQLEANPEYDSGLELVKDSYYEQEESDDLVSTYKINGQQSDDQADDTSEDTYDIDIDFDEE
ncbi:MAG TPA: hypothetical protein P5216_02165, partial [Bacteroidota bacterium]|nr:hypothetical protein [Bacteroidota bacterium]